MHFLLWVGKVVKRNQNILVVFAVFGSLKGKLPPTNTHETSASWSEFLRGVLQHPIPPNFK